MSAILLWGGLVAILALPAVLRTFGLQGAETLVLVGAFAMTVGWILLLLGR